MPDPTIVIEADGDEDAKKALKSLNFPVLDDDGLPSSYNQKVLQALGKWKLKMNVLVQTLDECDDDCESSKTFFDLS